MLVAAPVATIFPVAVISPVTNEVTLAIPETWNLTVGSVTPTPRFPW